MFGNVIITSKEIRPYKEALRTLNADYVTGVIEKWSRKARANYIVWTFSHNRDAQTYARQFMEMGFEFVKWEV